MLCIITPTIFGRRCLCSCSGVFWAAKYRETSNMCSCIRGLSMAGCEWEAQASEVGDFSNPRPCAAYRSWVIRRRSIPNLMGTKDDGDYRRGRIPQPCEISKLSTCIQREVQYFLKLLETRGGFNRAVSSSPPVDRLVSNHSLASAIQRQLQATLPSYSLSQTFTLSTLLRLRSFTQSTASNFSTRHCGGIPVG